MSRRGAASIVASPVLVGAVAILVSLVAVILSYNANQGLPFVPTYVISATLPGGNNLVEGNEVRAGGFRVGVVDRIGSQQVVDSRGDTRAAAVARMKLDKSIEELPLDSKVIVRPRSVLGLKYIEITPGSSAKTFRPGSTIPLKNAEGPVELDDFFNMFQEDVRDNNQSTLEGVGDSFAGRGPSINEALHEFVPFFVHLGPVMASLSAPRTELDRFFKEIGETTGDIARSCDLGSGPRRLPAGSSGRRASALAAQSPTCSQPVAVVQARLFSEMADTFEAFGRSPSSLRQFIEDTAPTNYQSIAAFRAQAPFLNDFTDLSYRLTPAARELPRSLPEINDALVVGQEVLPRTVRLNRNTEQLFQALEDLAENPNTLLALRDLRQTTAIGAPFLEYIAPYQTVCNHWNYMWTFLADDVGDERLAGGTVQRVLSRTGPDFQDDKVNDTDADRPADVPANQDPQEAQESDQEGFEEIEDELDRQLRRVDDTINTLQGLDIGDTIPDNLDLPGDLGGLPLPDDAGGLDAADLDQLDPVIDGLQELLDRLRRRFEELQDAGQADLTSLHNQPYQPAIDGQGRADCQIGQTGFPDRLVTTSRYPPSNDPEKNGGSHVALDSRLPGLSGPTFTGVPSLRAVDEEQRSRHPRGEVPEDGKMQRPNPEGISPFEPDPRETP